MIIENLDKIEILTPTGFNEFDGIRILNKNRLKFTFVNVDDYIVVSEDHKFNYDDTIDNIITANELNIDDYISHKDYGLVRIKSIENIGYGEVYDVLEVKDKHIYYANGLKHHNCSFVGSSKTIVSSDCLEDLNNSIKEPITLKYNGLMAIYEEPIPNAEYILGCDPAEGLGQDYSAIQVLKIVNKNNSVNAELDNQYKLVQVATYSSNRVKPRDFAQVCIGIARYYNMAWMMVENNNSAGGLVTNFIWNEFEYENLVNPTKTKNGKLGINSNKKTKYEANMKMAHMLENHLIKIVDNKTIQEINTYEEVKPKQYAASYSSAHDDMVTSLIWAIYFLETKWFEGYGEEFGQDIAEEFYIEPPAFVNASNLHKQQIQSMPSIEDIMKNKKTNNQGRWF